MSELKQTIAQILTAALSGEDKKYRLRGEYIRWGAVEQGISNAVGAAEDKLQARIIELETKLNEVLAEGEDDELGCYTIKRSDASLKEQLEYLIKLGTMVNEVEGEYGCFSHRIPEFVKNLVDQSAEFEAEVGELQAEITALKDDNSRLRMLLEEFIELKEHLPEWMLEAVEDGEASEPSLISRVEFTLSNTPEQVNNKLQAEVEKLRKKSVKAVKALEAIEHYSDNNDTDFGSRIFYIATQALAEQEDKSEQ